MSYIYIITEDDKVKAASSRKWAIRNIYDELKRKPISNKLSVYRCRDCASTLNQDSLVELSEEQLYEG
jgi:hypothetical protein